jgi:hypothetical protein
MRYQNLILAAAVLALACATWLERPKPVNAQTTYSQPVKVMNTGALQAVPVSGTVSVDNTVPVSGTVSVGNTVGVSGTVNVGNSILPVQPALSGTPIAFTGSCQPGANWSNPCTAVWPDPMSQKLIVIESLSCYVIAANSITFMGQLTWDTGSTQPTLRFPISNSGVYNGQGFYAYTGNLQLRAYSSPNTRINLQVFNSDAPGTSAPYPVYCSVSGVQY